MNDNTVGNKRMERLNFKIIGCLCVLYGFYGSNGNFLSIVVEKTISDIQTADFDPLPVAINRMIGRDLYRSIDQKMVFR